VNTSVVASLAITGFKMHTDRASFVVASLGRNFEGGRDATHHTVKRKGQRHAS